MSLGHTNYWFTTCNKFYFPGEPLELEEGDRVHVYSWIARDFLNEVGFPCKIHVVSAQGDAPLNAVLDEDELFDALENSNCLSWTMINSFYADHPKIKQVPNYVMKDTHEYLLKNAERLCAKPKKNGVYYNYSISNAFERLLTPNFPSKTYEEYMEEMSEYKYAYCPNGVGLDISKFYEAVACGVIPIVKIPEKFVKTYDRFNFVCIPGYSAVSYILDEPVLVDLQESPYIPEKTDVQNSIELLYETEPTRITAEEAEVLIKKMNDREYYRLKAFTKVPANNLQNHEAYLKQTGKLKR